MDFQINIDKYVPHKNGDSEQWLNDLVENCHDNVEGNNIHCLQMQSKDDGILTNQNSSADIFYENLNSDNLPDKKMRLGYSLWLHQHGKKRTVAHLGNAQLSKLEILEGKHLKRGSSFSINSLTHSSAKVSRFENAEERFKHNFKEISCPTLWPQSKGKSICKPSRNNFELKRIETSFSSRSIFLNLKTHNESCKVPFYEQLLKQKGVYNELRIESFHKSSLPTKDSIFDEDTLQVNNQDFSEHQNYAPDSYPTLCSTFIDKTDMMIVNPIFSSAIEFTPFPTTDLLSVSDSQHLFSNSMPSRALIKLEKLNFSLPNPKAINFPTPTSLPVPLSRMTEESLIFATSELMNEQPLKIFHTLSNQLPAIPITMLGMSIKCPKITHPFVAHRIAVAAISENVHSPSKIIEQHYFPLDDFLNTIFQNMVKNSLMVDMPTLPLTHKPCVPIFDECLMSQQDDISPTPLSILLKTSGFEENKVSPEILSWSLERQSHVNEDTTPTNSLSHHPKNCPTKTWEKHHSKLMLKTCEHEYQQVPNLTEIMLNTNDMHAVLHEEVDHIVPELKIINESDSAMKSTINISKILNDQLVVSDFSPALAQDSLNPKVELETFLPLIDNIQQYSNFIQKDHKMLSHDIPQNPNVRTTSEKSEILKTLAETTADSYFKGRNLNSSVTFEASRFRNNDKSKRQAQQVPNAELCENDISETSFYDDCLINMKVTDVDNIKRSKQSFCWNSVYNSLMNKSFSDNTTQELTEEGKLHPISQIVSSRRPLRVGLSKNQKVKHLHQQLFKSDNLSSFRLP